MEILRNQPLNYELPPTRQGYWSSAIRSKNIYQDIIFNYMQYSLNVTLRRYIPGGLGATAGESSFKRESFHISRRLPYGNNCRVAILDRR
jgi:hypothetical protein